MNVRLPAPIRRPLMMLHIFALTFVGITPTRAAPTTTNNRQALITSAKLTWSTFSGTSGRDSPNDVAVDPQGNILVTGTDEKMDAFVTKLSDSGSVRWSISLAGSDNGAGIAADVQGNILITGTSTNPDYTTDAFVTKVSESGSVLWSTMLPGTNTGAGIAADAQGNILVTGTDGTSNAFVTKVSEGGSVLWSISLGGSSYDTGTGIAVDAQGNILVTGTTGSADFPVLNAMQPVPDRRSPYYGSDVFATKLSPGGTMLWSTYISGNYAEQGGRIAADGQGNALIVGSTFSTIFPVADALQPQGGGICPALPDDTACNDAFLTKLSADGGMVWSTYLGGYDLPDYGYDIAVDGQDNVLVTGVAQSRHFPLLNALQAYGGSCYSGDVRGGIWCDGDAFVTKVSESGSMVWSTYFGGSRYDTGAGIAVDDLGNVLLAGRTGSPNFPIVNASQPSPTGVGGGFITSMKGADLASCFSQGVVSITLASGDTCAREVTIDTQDSVKPAIEGSKLVLETLNGLRCRIDEQSQSACKFEWLRSAGQSDADYKVSKDQDSTTPASQYNLALNGIGDAGHRFKLRVTDRQRNERVESAVLAIGPSKEPVLVHPITSGTETVRVRIPYFNVQNVTHDTHTPSNPSGSYQYDLQLSTNSSFPEANTIAIDNIPELSKNTNYGVTYIQSRTRLALGKTYYWRARAKIADAPGRWSAASSFKEAGAGAVWSETGNTWHWPLDASHRLSGVFREAYHAGDLGTRLHAGIDVAVCPPSTDVPKQVYAAMSGVLAPLTATRLEINQPNDLRSHYLHMNPRTTLPPGTYLNQGTLLGTASNVGKGVPCHLHFAVSNHARTAYYNPLQYLPAATATTTGWTNVTDPLVSSIRLRSVADPQYAYLSGAGATVVARTGIAGQADIIATANDPNGGSTLAPAQVQFFINPLLEPGAAAVHRTIDLGGTPLTANEHERQYFAYNNPNLREASRSNNQLYLLYDRWNTQGLQDAGPQVIGVRAIDFGGNPQAPGPQRTLTIGPELTTDRPNVCGPLPQTVEVHIRNHNAGLEALAAPFNNADRYTVTVEGANAAAVVDQLQVSIGNGVSRDINVQIQQLIGAQGSVTIRARSGILTDIGHSITMNVTATCP